MAGNILGARVLHAPRAVCGLVTPSVRVCAQSKLGGKASELVGFKVGHLKVPKLGPFCTLNWATLSYLLYILFVFVFSFFVFEKKFIQIKEAELDNQYLMVHLPSRQLDRVT